MVQDDLLAIGAEGRGWPPLTGDLGTIHVISQAPSELDMVLSALHICMRFFFLQREEIEDINYKDSSTGEMQW